MSQEPTAPLSERELELVRLLAKGLSNREIARELVISPNTVKVHLRNIYGKLQVSSRTEASVLALRQGWVEIEESQPAASTPEPVAGEAELAIEEAAAVSESEPEPEVVGVVFEPEPASPLPRWKQVYLAAAALLVAVGLWLIWPREIRTAEPFSDRPSPSVRWLPDQVARWQALAQMPTPRSRLAAVVHGERVYAIAGETANGVSSAVDIYLPDKDEWLRGDDKPTAVSNVGAVVLGAKIYVPGGTLADGQVSDLLEIYDASAEAWTTGRSLPHGVSAYAIAAHDGQLYLFGGWDGLAYGAQSYRYDPGGDVWTALAPMPTARAFSGAGVVGERIYVLGGYNGETELDTCEVYDPQSDTWEGCPPLNAPRGGIGVAVIADTLYVVGGGWDSYLVENEHFSPLSPEPTPSAWRTFSSPLLLEWRNLGVVANETTLFAIGGWNGEYLGVNQAYQAIHRMYIPIGIGHGSAEQ
jgi:DNA-binding CsgD family transcriptional regulator